MTTRGDADWLPNGFDVRELDRACDRFEAAWQAATAGVQPFIGDYLPPLDSPSRQAFFRELLAIDVEYRAATGLAPSAETYLEHFPEFAEFIVAACCGTIAFAPQPSLDATTLPGKAACDLRDVLAESGLLDSNASPAPNPVLGPVRVPGYEVGELLGRGGMGAVYHARQVLFNRQVAVKVILSGSSAGDAELDRFRTEAKAVARLNHPGILQVYETGVGLTDMGAPAPYLAMEFCPGGSLASQLGGNPVSPADAVALLLPLAEAVQAAHTVGVVHRDLKPANVLLDAAGRPKVADFGLAKLLDDDSRTHSGSLLGTPAYMSPEQAKDSKVVGPSSDVYALGAILYECLTGRPPFKAPTVLEVLSLVQSAEPVPVRQLQPGVPRDLETICLKCLRKEPHNRYESSQALADELGRFQRGEAIRGRPVSTFERTWRWARLHRAQAALYLVSGLSAAVLLALGFWFTARLGAARHEKDTATTRAENAELRNQASEAKADAARVQEQSQRFLALVSRARARLARPQPGWTWDALAEIREAAALPAAQSVRAELRSDAIECLTAVDVRPGNVIPADRPVWSLAWSPDGSTLAIGQRATNFLSSACPLTLVRPDQPGTVRTLSAPQGLVSGLRGSQDYLSIVCFSQDGKRVAAGSRAGWVHCWNLSRPEPTPEWSTQAHEKVVNGLVFSLDGLALFSTGGTIVRRSATVSGNSEATFEASGGVFAADLHPTEGWLAVSARRLERLNAKTLRPLGPSTEFDADRLAFAPNGLGLVLAIGNQVGLWDWRNGNSLRVLPALATRPGESISSVACSAGGTLVLATSADDQARRVRLWDAAAHRLVGEFSFDGGPGRCVFAPNGRSFAVADEKRVRLYEVAGLRSQTYEAFDPGQSVWAFAVSPGGLATEARGNLMSPVTDVEVLQPDQPLRTVRGMVHVAVGEPLHLSLSRGGNLAFGPRIGDLDLGILSASGTPTQVAVAGLHDLNHDPSGRLWAAIGENVQVWDRDGKLLGRHLHRGGLSTALTGKPGALSVAAGNRLTAVGCRDGSLLLLELRPDGLAMVTNPIISPVEVQAVAMSADESIAVASSADGKLTVVALPSGKVLSSRDHYTGPAHVVRSAGNGLWASGDRSGIVRLWSLNAGVLREIATLRHSRSVNDLQFYAGDLYVLLEGEHAVRVYKFDLLRTHLKELGLDGDLDVIRPVPLPPSEPPTPAPVEAATSQNGLRLTVTQGVFRAGPSRVTYPILHDCYFSEATPVSAKWEGWLKAPAPGKYTLAVEASGRVRFWLDGTLMSDSGGGSVPVDVDLGANAHRVVVEQFVLEGPAQFGMTWALAGEKRRRVVAPAFFFHDSRTAEQSTVPLASALRLNVQRTVSQPVTAFGFSPSSPRFQVAHDEDGHDHVSSFSLPGMKRTELSPESSIPWDDFTGDLSQGVVRNATSITLREVKTAKDLQTWQGEYSVARLSLDGKHVAALKPGGKGLDVWGTQTGKLSWDVGGTPTIRAVVWAADSLNLYLLRSDAVKGTIEIRNARDGVIKLTLELPGSENACLGVSGNGQWLVVTDQLGRLTLIDARTRRTTQWTVGPPGHLLPAAISPDGAIIAVGGPGGGGLWDCKGRCFAQLDPIKDYWVSVRFSPDGKTLGITLRGAPWFRVWQMTAPPEACGANDVKK